MRESVESSDFVKFSTTVSFLVSEKVEAMLRRETLRKRPVGEGDVEEEGREGIGFELAEMRRMMEQMQQRMQNSEERQPRRQGRRYESQMRRKRILSMKMIQAKKIEGIGGEINITNEKET